MLQFLFQFAHLSLRRRIAYVDTLRSEFLGQQYLWKLKSNGSLVLRISVMVRLKPGRYVQLYMVRSTVIDSTMYHVCM